MNRNIRIGLFGFGVVGEGIYHVLQQTPTLNAQVKKVCIRNGTKQRNAPAELFTTSYSELINDPQINVIVELIDDADEAFKIVSAALLNGKAVVTANKKMIAEHLSELLQLQQQTGMPLLYEAAACGSIPIIRNLEEYYDNDLLQSLCGIVNGSTNYILTRMSKEKLSYSNALSEAQMAGFAESDPALDVEGNDPLNKLIILLAHAYGVIAKKEKMLVKGITALHQKDAEFAEEKSYQLKLTAQARKLSNGKIAAFVLPQFVTEDSKLYNVDYEYNGVVVESRLADKQFLYGKGAGRYPTSSAVLSDIAALRYSYKYEYRKLNSGSIAELTSDYYLRVFVSFTGWDQLNKWDFEQIEEFHSTDKRQYLVGLIHASRLHVSEWLYDRSVSVIVMPNGVVEKETITLNSIKKISLQLAGSY